MAKTLTINFTLPTPTPVNGFIVKYREIGTGPYTTVYPNPTGSPVSITVADGKSYEGSIQSDCGSGYQSQELAFTTYGSTAIITVVGYSTDLICSSEYIQYYISNAYTDITSGTKVYLEESLTNLLMGPTFIMNSSGVIFELNNGIVGAPTGDTC